MASLDNQTPAIKIKQNSYILITDIKEPSSLTTRVTQVLVTSILMGLSGLLIAHFGGHCPWNSLNIIGYALTGAGLGIIFSTLIVQKIYESDMEDKITMEESYRRQSLPLTTNVPDDTNTVIFEDTASSSTVDSRKH